MQLDTLVVVDEHVLFLCYSEHVVISQETNVTDELLSLELTDNILLLPLHHRDVSLLGRQKQMLSISGEVHGSVGSEVLKVEVEDGLGILHI
jgi:hypothetical protein